MWSSFLLYFRVLVIFLYSNLIVSNSHISALGDTSKHVQNSIVCNDKNLGKNIFKRIGGLPMEALINGMVGVFSPRMRVSNHQVAHFKHITIFLIILQ